MSYELFLNDTDARRWPGLNLLTAGAPVLPDATVDLFGFSAWQATFDAMVEVEWACAGPATAQALAPGPRW